MAVYVFDTLAYRGPPGRKVGYPEVKVYGRPGLPAQSPAAFERVTAAFRAAHPDHQPFSVYTLEEALASGKAEVRAAAEHHVAEQEALANAPPRPRGFAAMSPEKRLEAARKGGRSLPPEKRSFHVNPQLARAAGMKGGMGNAKRYRRSRRA